MTWTFMPAFSGYLAATDNTAHSTTCVDEPGNPGLALSVSWNFIGFMELYRFHGTLSVSWKIVGFMKLQ
ncbi:hypothetical protein BTA51_10840 [Hahella sp. CCB-MM4]|uniref:hypothetical protein n=1 Tax=Hahella sp. (strain CCB-MM4) TaxID=1926491 RepID=UPI000B9A6859|nr:hypothetical protein [Hahella sp. CCB-MM4]OZG73504.1 hypothetical protein BTA51_10840 [Hahella sp. CCB-MM4]